MRTWSKWAASALTLIAVQAGVARAQTPEPRLALVIGESAYAQDALPTAANDAGLIASTLSNEGFDVTGARDLDDDALRQALREFAGKAAAAGPNAVVFVYIAGQGLQLEGENYLVPIGAQIARDTDVPLNSYRLSDFTRALDAIPLKARIVVLDAAHANHLAQGGEPLASGLAITDPAPGSLIAYNATPDTVAPPESGPYGLYAQALNDMLRQPGLPLDAVFNKTRMEVNDESKGVVTPWDIDKVTAPFVFLERGEGAPAPVVSAEQLGTYETQPIRDFPEADAYYAALDRDTIDGYDEFLTAFPASPQAVRVRWLLAVRREAVIWRITFRVGTPNAYWSYLRRYPDGPHIWDARRLLAHLRAEFRPPVNFELIRYDVPPPSREEIVMLNRRVVVFKGPPPPPPPVYFVERRAREQIAPPADEPGAGRYVLPLLPAAAAIAAIPIWAHLPRGVPQSNRTAGGPHVRPPQFMQDAPGEPGQPGARVRILPQSTGPQSGVPMDHALPQAVGSQPLPRRAEPRLHPIEPGVRGVEPMRPMTITPLPHVMPLVVPGALVHAPTLHVAPLPGLREHAAPPPPLRAPRPGVPQPGGLR